MTLRCPGIWNVVFALTTIFSTTFDVNAQEDRAPLENIKGSAEKARVDFAVPDIPAFKLLETEPGSILRPANLREVGLIVSDLVKGGGVLPGSFAAELAPALLIGKKSLQSYKKIAFWQKARISAATHSLDSGATELGWGLRFTLIDETDLRTDPVFTRQLVELGKTANFITDECAAKVIREVSDPGSEEYIEKLNACRDSMMSVHFADDFDSLVASLREETKKRNWNKRILEVGFAEVLSSQDSLARSLVASKYGLWVTFGFPFAGAGGQGLIGVKQTLRNDDKNKMKSVDCTLASRNYLGTNGYKGFIEADWAFGNNRLPGYTLSLGAELNAANGIWLEASMGVKKEIGQSIQVTSNFAIRFATPEISVGTQ